MNKLQITILDVFKEFQRVCEEEGLRYFAIGGTCLGAVRHKGFIPWDDDLDVAMPLEDYEKFRHIYYKKLNAPYELYDFEEHRHNIFKFLKLHNGSTTFIEDIGKEYPDRYTGIFMDIMPIVGFPDDENEGKSHLKKCLWLSKLNKVLRFNITQQKSWKQKLFGIICTPFMIGKPFNYYSLKYEKLTGKYKFGSTKYVLFPWRIPVRAQYKNVFPISVFEESISVPFEDTEIRIPKEYDTYLKMDFGNYMQLPPEEKRHGGHQANIIHFDKSYKVFQ